MATNSSSNSTGTSVANSTDVVVAEMTILATVGMFTLISCQLTTIGVRQSPAINRRKEMNILLRAFTFYMLIAACSQLAQGIRGSFAAMYEWPDQSQWDCMKTVHITLNIAGWIGLTTVMVAISIDRLLCSLNLGTYYDSIDRAYLLIFYGLPTFIVAAAIAAAWGLAASFDPDRKISSQCTTGSTLTAPYFLFLNFLQLMGAVVFTASFYAISYILMLRPHCNTSAIQWKQLESEKAFTRLLAHVPFCTLTFFVIPQAIYMSFSYWAPSSQWLSVISNVSAVLKGLHSIIFCTIFLTRKSEVRDSFVNLVHTALRLLGCYKKPPAIGGTPDEETSYINSKTTINRLMMN